MQSEIIGQVTDVQGRETASGTIFDVTINGQKVSTWKVPIAEKANALKGQNAKATVNVTPWQKGEKSGTNYTLLDIEGTALLAGSGITAGAHVYTPSIGAGSNVQPEAPQAIPVAAAPQNGSQGLTGASQPDERQQQIVKQSSLKTAFGYAGASGLSEEEAFALAQRLYTSVMGLDAVPAQATLEQDLKDLTVGDVVGPATVVDDIKW